METILRKGANAVLTDTGQVRIQLVWDNTRLSLDTLCFAVGAQGRIPDDHWFLFYNQLASPDAAIQLDLAVPGQANFRFALERLPAHIEKCVIAAAVESGQFRDSPNTTLTATAPATGKQLIVKLGEFGTEQALIFAELYRHQKRWKLRAVGQGFDGGLKPLAEYFGVNVADDSPAPTAPAPPPKSRPEARPESPPESRPKTRPRPQPRPQPRPVPDRSPPGRRARRSPWPWLILLFLGALGGGIWGYFELGPDWFANHFMAGNPDTAEPVATCELEVSEVMEHYHALGESYIRTLEQIDLSNQRLVQLRQALKQAVTQCPADFASNNQGEMYLLELIPFSELMDQAVMLNVCAGGMIARVEQQLQGESRPVVLQRLLQEADRARNLESDLTNISRDLAYLRNKAERLGEGYRENIAACAP